MTEDEKMQQFLKDLKKDKRYQFYLKSFKKVIGMHDDKYKKYKQRLCKSKSKRKRISKKSKKSKRKHKK